MAERLLRATLARLESLGAVRELIATPDGSADAIVRWLEAESLADRWRVVPQGGGDLGERMRRQLAAGSGSTATLLLGSDSPDVPLSPIADAVGWLAERPQGLVLGPADDGGYWLVGTRGAPPPIFEDMPWGTSDVLSETLRRLADSGWQGDRDYRLVGPWYDVDRIDSLNALRSRLTRASTDDAALSQLRRELDELLGPLAALP